MESFALARDRAYGTRSQPRGPMVCTRSREPMSTARSEVLPRNLVKPGQCSRSCLTGCWRLPKGWSIDRSRVRTLALKLPRFVTCSPRPHSRRSSVAAGSVSAGYRAGRPPFEDDIRLVTDRAQTRMLQMSSPASARSRWSYQQSSMVLRQPGPRNRKTRRFPETLISTLYIAKVLR